MEKDSIHGKVVKIICNSMLVINVGSEHGVTKGMKFIIYNQGDEIIDPDTQKALGKIELVKAQVEVIHIQEKMSLAATPEIVQEKEVLSAQMAKIPRSPDIPFLYSGRRESLLVNESQISPLKEIRPISIGDLVKLVD